MARKRPAPRVLKDTHLPVPTGGMDAVTVPSAMSQQAGRYFYNLMPGEFGLHVRPGYREHVTDIHGVTHHNVRTAIGYSGSTRGDFRNRLYAVTDLGIWDATNSTDNPTDVINFPSPGAEAGFGSWVVMSTSGGRFILYCDERNGLYIYTESTDTWAKAVAGTTAAWESETAYVVGDRVVNNSKVYVCDVAGTSGLTGPTGTGSDITDGSARWDYVSAAASNVIGPSVADQRLGYALDPADFVHVAVWKSRVFVTLRDSTLGAYLDVDSVYGTATSFNFGAKFQKGGPLIGLWNWSYDGGSGLDTHLVGVSQGGDVVIYQGTDPDYSDTFGLKGCWYVGDVPAGRRFVSDTGGELFIISAMGVVPLSRLVVGAEESDVTNTLTARIAPLFARLFTSYRRNRGWTLHVHPRANGLLMVVPTSDSGDVTHLFYSFATKGWFQWRNLPALSVTTYDGELYFGTDDGRMCINEGALDDVKLADSSDNDEIPYSGLTAFTNLGNARNKKVELIRPVLHSETVGAHCQATARYDYNFFEPTAPTTIQNTSGGWDTGLWDTETWDGQPIAQSLYGATGMGRAVAVAFQGLANSPTAIIGFDVQFVEGGSL